MREWLAGNAGMKNHHKENDMVSDERRFLLFLCVLAIAIAGCEPPTGKKQINGKPQSEAAAVRVLVIGHESLAKSMEAQAARQFAENEQPEFRSVEPAAIAGAKRLSADVVIYSGHMLGEFVERDLVLSVPESLISGEDSAIRLPFEDVLPNVRSCDASWGRRLFALPVSIGRPVLVYRRDLFEKLAITPPKTWSDYAKAAEKLADRDALSDLAPPEDQAWYAALEPTSGEWAAETLLLRASSSIRTEGQQFTLFNTEDMQARIALPPFVRAAEEMGVIAKISKWNESRFTPKEVFAKFLAGECGMAITVPQAAYEGTVKGSWAIAPLPSGSQRYQLASNSWKNGDDSEARPASYCGYASVLASVTKEARRSRSAFQFLQWLSKQENAQVIGPAAENPGPAMKSQIAAIEPWLPGETASKTQTDYAAVVEASASATAWMPTIRVPGASDYRRILAAATERVLQGSAAEESLQTAAKEWNAHTATLERSVQRRAYQRSVGNDF